MSIDKEEVRAKVDKLLGHNGRDGTYIYCLTRVKEAFEQFVELFSEMNAALLEENERLTKERNEARHERWEYEKGMADTHSQLTEALKVLEWYGKEIVWMQGRYEGGLFFTVAEDDAGQRARQFLSQYEGGTSDGNEP